MGERNVVILVRFIDVFGNDIGKDVVWKAIEFIRGREVAFCVPQ